MKRTKNIYTKHYDMAGIAVPYFQQFDYVDHQYNISIYQLRNKKLIEVYENINKLAPHNKPVSIEVINRYWVYVMLFINNRYYTQLYRLSSRKTFGEKIYQLSKNNGLIFTTLF